VPPQSTPTPTPTVAEPTVVSMGLGAFTFNATFSGVTPCPNGGGPTEQRSTDTAYYATFSGSSCEAVLTPTLPRPHLPTLTRHAPTRNAADGHIGPPTA
jgi:hypothetical protein